MPTLSTVRFLDGGFCTQRARLVGEKSCNKIPFHAVFVYIEHPVHGPALIDTGYSQHFYAATQPFPQRIYRWITPVTLASAGDPDQVLQANGIDPQSIPRIFVSHFHADHIGGAKCFPKAEFVYREAAWRHVTDEPVRTQVRHGYLFDLLPADFRSRGVPLLESRFVPGTGPLAPFQICDYWEDGSLILVDLPGHADGHFGIVLQTETERVFYIVDACWHLDVMLNNWPLPWLSLRFQFDGRAYQATQSKLRDLAQLPDWNLVACHCPRTMRRIVAAVNLARPSTGTNAQGAVGEQVLNREQL